MVIPTGINVNKNKRVEKMTKEEVKVLIQEQIQELKDDMKSIHSKLHREHDREQAAAYHKKMNITDKNIDEYFTD